MDRRTFIGSVATAILAVPLCCGGQQAEQVYTIGYLDQGSRAASRMPEHPLPTLLANLRKFGYVEGKNLSVEARFAEGRPENLSPLAAELVAANPQAIVVASAGLAEVVLRQTKTIPVVALTAGQLEAEESIASLAKPGGNLTGMQIHSPETIGKRLQLLQEIVPALQRVVVLRGVPFEGRGFALYRDATDTAAARLGIRARYVQFEQPSELGNLFREMVKERDQALLVWGNPHLNTYRKQIFDLTMQYRMPAMYDTPGYAEELVVYTAKLDDVHREAATYVDRILRGAKAGDLPIGQAKVFQLIVNLKTAKALGLTIPRSVLLRADEVIQ